MYVVPLFPLNGVKKKTEKNLICIDHYMFSYNCNFIHT